MVNPVLHAQVALKYRRKPQILLKSNLLQPTSDQSLTNVEGKKKTLLPTTANNNEICGG